MRTESGSPTTQDVYTDNLVVADLHGNHRARADEILLSGDLVVNFTSEVAKTSRNKSHISQCWRHRTTALA